MKDTKDTDKNKDVPEEGNKWKWGKKELRPKFIKMDKNKSPKKQR